MKRPHLSLFFGFLLIMVTILYFGYIQYTSSHHLEKINAKLRLLTIDAVSLHSENNLEPLLNEYSDFLKMVVFVNFQSTFTEPLPYGNIRSSNELLANLNFISSKLDQYRSDLYRSLVILILSFFSLSVIFSIILLYSDYDQAKKIEKEKNQRLLDQKLMELLEHEKNMIAVELHDDVAQKLSVLGQHFNSTSDAEHTEVLRRYNSDVIYKIRSMAQSLKSPDIRNHSFQKQLEFLFSDFRSICSIKMNARFNGLAALNLSDEKKLHIYRIIQELLSNCCKHSHADLLDISVLYVHPLLKIDYHDDGVGYNNPSRGNGMGLRSIDYRLNILHGEMETLSRNGLSIIIKIPVEL